MTPAEKLAEEIFRLIERDRGLIKDDLIKLITEHMPAPKFNGKTWLYGNTPTVTYFDCNDIRTDPFPPPPDPLPTPTSTLDLRQHQGNDYLAVIPSDIVQATTKIVTEQFGEQYRPEARVVLRKFYECMRKSYTFNEIKQWLDWSVGCSDMFVMNEPTGIMLEMSAWPPRGNRVELRMPLLYSDMRKLDD